MTRIPDHGMPRDELFVRLETFRGQDVDWRSGRTWAYVYDPGRETEEVVKQAFSSYLSENGLDPTAFPSALALENEIVAMAIAHLNGDANVVGTFTRAAPRASSSPSRPRATGRASCSRRSASRRWSCRRPRMRPSTRRRTTST